MAGPLQGLKVLDFSALLPGPFATLVLADLGAEVLCVKAPQRQETRELTVSEASAAAPVDAWLGRGKRSLVLDLKHPKGREIALELARKHEVFIEQFRPGVMDRLGLGWEALREKFPGLIYCSLTGYGQTGPLAQRAGHDINYVALSGLMSHSGRRGQGPSLPGTQIADLASGAMGLLVALLAALLHRRASGRGQRLDLSMTDGAMWFNAVAAASYLAGGREYGREDWLLNGGSLYDFYQCADGGYMSFGSLEPKFSAAALKALGLPELAEGGISPRDVAGAKQKVAQRFKSKTRDQWRRVFSELDVCVEPVLGLAEALEGEQARARGLVREVPLAGGGKTRQLGLPFKFSATPPAYGEAGHAAGAHTHEVMAELGYSRDQVLALERDGLFG
ncbi:hypothetical protein AAU61_06440 [Desulfocarbo indianensis]|nr:hypothetical protein AAU61_06440 [Desulfocarbo indianensis]